MNKNVERKKKLKEKAQRRQEHTRKIELKTIDSHMAVIDAKYPDRRCDGCTTCCTVMGVTEFRKPYYETCKHICEEGCAVYEERPRSCYGFLCGWRAGIVDGKRPDKQGLMVDGLLLSGFFVQVVYEAWPGAGEESDNLTWITDQAQKNGDVLFVKYGETGRLKWWLTGEVVREGQRCVIPPALVLASLTPWRAA